MPSNHCETDFVENHYYRANQIFLSMLDLWPYRRSKFARINSVFHFALMLSIVFFQLLTDTYFQLTSFLTIQLTINSIVMVLSYAVPSLLFIIQYYSFYDNSNVVKHMWKSIRNNWSLLKNERERDIMRQYSSSGELLTILIALSIMMSFFLYVFLELMPIILDIILPLNETRPRELHALTEYFVDEKTYFYAILCHWLIGLFFNSFVIIATSTLELVYVEHICALFKIASYRIEHLLDKYILCDSIQGDHIIIRNISAAVNIHRRALECCEFLMVTFASTFFFLIIIAVASLSLNLFRLLKAIILLQNVNELIASILFVGLHFFFMFLGNYFGQKITDHNSEVFEKTYNIQWYMVPVEIQKLLLFIMQNTTELYVLNFGRVINASIEGFTKLTSMSISYFTVIYSLL